MEKEACVETGGEGRPWAGAQAPAPVPGDGASFKAAQCPHTAQESLQPPGCRVASHTGCGPTALLKGTAWGKAMSQEVSGRL